MRSNVNTSRPHAGDVMQALAELGLSGHIVDLAAYNYGPPERRLGGSDIGLECCAIAAGRNKLLHGRLPGALCQIYGGLMRFILVVDQHGLSSFCWRHCPVKTSKSVPAAICGS